jgi:hypothetical protein
MGSNYIGEKSLVGKDMCKSSFLLRSFYFYLTFTSYIVVKIYKNIYPPHTLLTSFISVEYFETRN